MPQVVAVNHVLAKQVAELQEDKYLLVGQDRIDVPPACLQRWNSVIGNGLNAGRGIDRNGPAVKNTSLLQVDVDGMCPTDTREAVSDEPGFRRALGDGRIRAIGVKGQPVDVEYTSSRIGRIALRTDNVEVEVPDPRPN